MIEQITLTVYGLADPITQRVRYVGRTRNTKLRYQAHLKQPQSRGMREWIGQLSADGKQPSLIIFETAPAAEADAREQHWINAMTAKHGPLFNVYQSTPVPIGQRYTKKVISFQIPVSWHTRLKALSKRRYGTIPAMLMELICDAFERDDEMSRRQEKEIEEKSIGWVW